MFESRRKVRRQQGEKLYSLSKPQDKETFFFFHQVLAVGMSLRKEKREFSLSISGFIPISLIPCFLKLKLPGLSNQLEYALGVPAVAQWKGI